MAPQLSPDIDGHSSQLLASLVTANTLVTEPSESSTVNNSKLVFDGDILILAIFACFVLLSLHRAYYYFFRGFEWLQGHILCYKSPDKWRNHYPSAAEKGVDTTRSKRLHTPHSDNHHLEERRRTSMFPPPHTPAISSILHPLASPFARRIIPGFSVGQATILGVYGGILQYESFYKSNIFTDPIRTGFVATAQIPFVFALATKNNLLGGLVGLGYEKVINPSDRYAVNVRSRDYLLDLSM
jgi:hypothetical protein